ncbi:hypothetical protein HC891_06580 [Candidatus Gracilibacteria bacterium]|nr:hypothetical protein [Candidatus Gracilibacteria bacterium]
MPRYDKLLAASIIVVLALITIFSPSSDTAQLFIVGNLCIAALAAERLL